MKYNLLLPNPSRPTNNVQFVTFINKQRVKIGTGVKVETNKWDKATQSIVVKSGDKELQGIADKLDDAVHAIKKCIRAIEASEDVELTGATVKEALRRKRNELEGMTKQSLSFTQWVDEFMTDLEEGKRFGSSGKALSEGTIKRYRVVHELLKSFRREKRRNQRIDFADVDVKFINDWKRWRADGATIGRKVVRNPVNINTLNNDLKILKVWLKQSYLDQLHDNRIWQRNEMSKTVVVPKRPRLTKDELKQLEGATFDHLRKGPQGPKSSAHEHVRDMFLLACWTAARISDVRRFPELVATMWKDQGGECPRQIEIIQSKTNTYARIPIISPAKRIIDKYDGKLPNLPKGPKTNRVLKEVIKAAGITRSFQKVSTSIDGGKPEMVKVYDAISFHDARRTCLTNFYLLNVMTVAELMLISGHSTEAQFFQYIELDKQEMLDQAAEKLLAATAHL